MAWQIPRVSRSLEDKSDSVATLHPWRILDLESLSVQRTTELSRRRKLRHAASESSGEKLPRDISLQCGLWWVYVRACVWGEERWP